MSDYDEGFRAGVEAAASLFDLAAYDVRWLSKLDREECAEAIRTLRPPAPSETAAPCPVLGMHTDADIAGHSAWSANEGSTADQWRARCSCDWHTDVTTEADADRAVQAHLEQYVYGPARVATERAATCPVCEAAWLDAKTPGQVWSKMKQALVPCPKCGTGRARGVKR